MITREERNDGTSAWGETGPSVALDERLRVVVMAAVAHDPAHAVEQGGSVQQLAFGQSVAVQGSQLFEASFRQEADVVGVLLLVVVVTCQAEDTESTDSGDHGLAQVLPEAFKEDAFTDPVLRNRHRVDVQSIHNARENHSSG